MRLGVFLACFVQAFTEEIAPYLQIQNVDCPSTQVTSPVWVEPGQSLVLKCFVNCTGCLDRHSVQWHRNLNRLSDVDGATYECSHVRRNLTKRVRVELMNRRRKREEYTGRTNLPTFDELLKQQRELLDQLHLDFNPVPESPSNVDHYGNEVYDSTLNTDEKKPKNGFTNRIIIIVIIIVVLVTVLFLIVYCIRLRLKSGPTSMTTSAWPRNTDGRELRSLNTERDVVRPTDMYTAPYPPAIDPVEVPDVTTEPAPPPSYDEAMSNSRPTAPPLLNSN